MVGDLNGRKSEENNKEKNNKKPANELSEDEQKSNSPAAFENGKQEAQDSANPKSEVDPAENQDIESSSKSGDRNRIKERKSEENKKVENNKKSAENESVDTQKSDSAELSEEGKQFTQDFAGSKSEVDSFENKDTESHNSRDDSDLKGGQKKEDKNDQKLFNDASVDEESSEDGKQKTPDSNKTKTGKDPDENQDTERSSESEDDSDLEEEIDEQEELLKRQAEKSHNSRDDSDLKGEQKKEDKNDQKLVNDEAVNEESSEDGKHEMQDSDKTKTGKDPDENQDTERSGESEDDSDLEEEIDEQEELLKRQEQLLVHISVIEKRQSEHMHLRPCNSCEFFKPFPKDESWCGRFCFFLRRKKTIPKAFWIVSVPGDPDPQQAFNKLEEKTEKLSLNYKFHIPKLRVGTLDELMFLTEELKALDRHTDDMIHRFVEFMNEVLVGTKNIHQFFQVNGMNVMKYITRFTWNPAKYDIIKHLPELKDRLSVEMKRLSEKLKARKDDYHELDRSLDKIESQKTGNLFTRSLVDIVKKEHFILNSGYLTTLLVIVPIKKEAEWLQSYQTFTDMVFPNSAVKIFEDNTHMLYTVILCKKRIEEFRNNARDHKCFVRDFEYNEEKLAEERDLKRALQKLKETQIAVLRRWLKANFSEGFESWMHIKALIIVVESVLKFGLPINFQAVLLIPLKGEEKLRNALDELYGGIDNVLSRGIAQDVPGALAAYDVVDYTPYVFTKIEFDAKLPKIKD